MPAGLAAVSRRRQLDPGENLSKLAAHRIGCKQPFNSIQFYQHQLQTTIQFNLYTTLQNPGPYILKMKRSADCVLRKKILMTNFSKSWVLCLKGIFYENIQFLCLNIRRTNFSVSSTNSSNSSQTADNSIQLILLVKCMYLVFQIISCWAKMTRAPLGEIPHHNFLSFIELTTNW